MTFKIYAMAMLPYEKSPSPFFYYGKPVAMTMSRCKKKGDLVIISKSHVEKFSSKFTEVKDDIVGFFARSGDEYFHVEIEQCATE